MTALKSVEILQVNEIAVVVFSKRPRSRQNALTSR